MFDSIPFAWQTTRHFSIISGCRSGVQTWKLDNSALGFASSVCQCSHWIPQLVLWCEKGRSWANLQNGRAAGCCQPNCESMSKFWAAITRAKCRKLGILHAWLGRLGRAPVGSQIRKFAGRSCRCASMCRRLWSLDVSPTRGARSCGMWRPHVWWGPSRSGCIWGRAARG